MPPQKFDDLAFTGYFVHDYRTAATVAYDTLSFAAPTDWVTYADGIERETDGARIRSGRGRFLLTLYWPWVTHVRLAVKLNASKPTTVRLRSSGFALGTDLGAMLYTPGNEELEWALPKGGFDSGINEVVVEADNDITLRSLQFIDRTDHDLSLH